MKLIGHIWALPNTLIGSLFGLGGVYRLDRANRVFVVRGGWVVALFHRLGYVGMCVGDVVLCADNLPIRFPAVYRHELVHAAQSRLFGPFYLPLTLLGYAVGALLCPPCPHDGSPLEIWAEVASGHTVNPQVRVWYGLLRVIDRNLGRPT